MSATQEVGEIFGEGSGPAHAMLRSPTVLIASVGLWGMNVYFFRLFGINYVKVLKHDLLLLENGEFMGHDRKKKEEREHRRDDGGGGASDASSVVGGGGGGSVTGGGGTMKERTSLSATGGGGELSKKASDAFENSDDEDLDNNNNNNDDESVSGEDVPVSAVTWERLVCLSILLLFLLHSTYYMWIDVLDGGQLGAVFAFYFVVLFAIVLPLPTTRWLRKSTVIALQRSFELVNPRCSCVNSDPIYGPRPVPFVDVFFADAMCSLSKVFFDWGMLLQLMAHYPDPLPPSAGNILFPSACAAIPFVVRARQCLIMYNACRVKSDPKRFDHLWNALKYSTSIFPLLLSAYQKTIDPKKAKGLEVYLIILLAINALYALYWDIVMDWGMMQKPRQAVATVSCIGGQSGAVLDRSKRTCGHAFMRPRLRFGVVMSACIVAADSVLRFSWTLRFYTKLFPSQDSFVLCTQFLEVFRRAIWNLLRVEWENLKQIKASNAATIASSKSSSSAAAGGSVAMTVLSNKSGSSSTVVPAVADNDDEVTSFLPAGHQQGGKKQGKSGKTGAPVPISRSSSVERAPRPHEYQLV